MNKIMNKKLQKNKITRRQFTKASTLAVMGFQVVPSRVFGANSRLAVAAIGAGGGRHWGGGKKMGWEWRGRMCRARKCFSHFDRCT